MAVRQASLSITNSRSSLRLTSIESVMPSSHLILCRPLLLLPPIPPSIRVFSNESTLCIRWPKFWSFSFSISPSNEYSGLIFFRMDWLDLLAVQGTLKSLLQHHSSKAYELKTLRVPLRAKFPPGLKAKLFGMRGFPQGWTQENGLDLGNINQVLLFVHKPSADHQFEVSNIRATGTRTVTAPSDPDKLFPLIDRYGQFIHKDWPGKINSDEDLAKARRAEADDLVAHAGPKDWDQYGGWLSGPKLKATGRFRVEKVEGRWWLVDPEGRLFWSHGVDCVNANNSTPITDRETWFAKLPSQDSPMGRFFGRANWAPHGYYQDKQGYQTYNFTGANLWRKYGEGWAGQFAELAHRRLRSWGMNTIANWSDASIYAMRKTPY